MGSEWNETLVSLVETQLHHLVARRRLRLSAETSDLTQHAEWGCVFFKGLSTMSKTLVMVKPPAS